MYCRSSTAHCPQAVRQCVAGGPLPTAPRQWGSVLQKVHCPLPPGSEAVYCRSSTPLPGGTGLWTSCNTLPHCLGAVGSGTPAIHCPTAWGQWAVDLLQYTASLPRGSGQGSVLQEFHCPLPPGSEVVYCRRSTARCPRAVGQCIAGGPLHIALRQ